MTAGLLVAHALGKYIQHRGARLSIAIVQNLERLAVERVCLGVPRKLILNSSNDCILVVIEPRSSVSAC